LTEIEHAWADAVERRDVDAAEQLLAEDFQLSSAGGVAPVMPRAAWLAMLPDVDTRSLACEVLEERVFGDVGVARVNLVWDASVQGRDLSGEYAVTDVFTRDGDRWRASWRVSVRLTGDR
jgi:ketosteroid isomerase-like protein